MELGFIIYILVSIATTLGGTYGFFVSGRPVTAAIFGLSVLICFIQFGVKWYTLSGESTQQPSGPWPPVINVCPDFLSLSSVDGKPVCVDRIGISNGGISKWTDPSQKEEKYIFKLYEDEKDPDTRSEKLCQECKDKVVTWEGIQDPASGCIGGYPPYPPSV